MLSLLSSKNNIIDNSNLTTTESLEGLNYRKKKEKDKALTAWYNNGVILNITILLCSRGSFSYFDNIIWVLPICFFLGGITF